MNSSTTLGERQTMMRERIKRRPCKDGRSRKARRARARLVRLEDVVPRTPDYAVKRRAVRFMLSKNFSHAYIANQLGMSRSDLEKMIREDEPEREPGKEVRMLLRGQEREKRRDARNPLAKLWKPESEVTFVTAFGGEVKALTEKEAAARRLALARIRERELLDAERGAK